MHKNSDSNSQGSSEKQTTHEKECFVIMPISDRPPYEEEHFRIVYDYLIKPACEKAGFMPVRSDQVQETNFIVKDILKRLLNSDMAICDISGQNPNVLFELGIRQSFNLPVTIIKDSITPRIFDIDGLRCVDYDDKLRIDNIKSSINVIADTLKNTYESKGNSLIESLSITPAKVPTERVLSDDTTIILDALKNINNQLNLLKHSDKYRHLNSKLYNQMENDVSKTFIACFPKIKSKYSDEDIVHFATDYVTNEMCLNDNEFYESSDSEEL